MNPFNCTRIGIDELPLLTKQKKHTCTVANAARLICRHLTRDLLPLTFWPISGLKCANATVAQPALQLRNPPFFDGNRPL